MTLVEFLLARIAEDENAARWASVSDYSVEWHLITPDTVMIGPGLAASMSQKAAPHVARQHPGRVLAECEAKRRIVGLHEMTEHDGCGECGPDTGLSIHAQLCPTLRLLALPYADHPDYREEWRP